MIPNALLSIWCRSKALRSILTMLGLSVSSLVFSSCTTEEGIVAGALAGAAIGGIVGHSHEHSYRPVRYGGHYYGHGGASYSYYPGYSSYGRRAYVDPYCY